MTIDDINNKLQESWTNSVDWRCVELEINEDHLIGIYQVNQGDPMASTDDASPYKLILHGTDTNVIATYHSLVHSLYALKNNFFEIADFSQVPFSEIRRRVLLVKTHMRFKKPIFSDIISIESSLSCPIQKKKLFFYEIDLNICYNSQYIKNTLCFSLRDKIDEASL